MELAAQKNAPLLALNGVTKRFDGVTALDGVDFDLHRGEIHALLGQNGAGKSTLIKVLAGIHTPNAGRISMDGQPVHIRNVADADRCGIRVIHQELSLAPNLSVAENIYLGKEPHTHGWLHRERMRSEAHALINRLGLKEIGDAQSRISELSIAQRQLVEIARALSSRAHVLVLDEPTSSLSEAETQVLFTTLRLLRSQGVGIIYISHRLEEIIQLTDRITVMRNGRMIGTQPTKHVNQRELVNWMVGRDITNYFHRPTVKKGSEALTVRDITNSSVHGVSFSVRYGEILGIAGLVGSGRSELARAIFGIDTIERGEILIDGRPARVKCPNDAIKAGIVLVPEDRARDGLVMINSAAFNLALPWTKEWNPGIRPDWTRRREIVTRALNDFGIGVAHPEQEMSSLSGGNQQKVLVGRWMEHRPKVMILDEPTRGVDVGAREDMFRSLNTLIEQNMAVVLISSDLEEVLNMSHRIAIYRDGRILSTVSADSITMDELMEDLTGARIND